MIPSECSISFLGGSSWCRACRCVCFVDAIFSCVHCFAFINTGSHLPPRHPASIMPSFCNFVLSADCSEKFGNRSRFYDLSRSPFPGWLVCDEVSQPRLVALLTVWKSIVYSKPFGVACNPHLHDHPPSSPLLGDPPASNISSCWQNC